MFLSYFYHCNLTSLGFSDWIVLAPGSTIKSETNDLHGLFFATNFVCAKQQYLSRIFVIMNGPNTKWTILKTLNLF